MTKKQQPAKKRRPATVTRSNSPERPIKVSVAYVHPLDLATSFVDSLLGLAQYDAATAGYLAHEAGRVPIRCGTNGLIQARNMAAKAMVESDVDWLLWVDTDMGFAPDALEQLLHAAHPTERPIVGGLCMVSREVEPDGMFGWRTYARPTLFQYGIQADGLKHFAARKTYPVNTLCQVDATGSAFVLIHRSVFEKLGPNPYDRIPDQGGLLGEDISFCARARVAGFPIFVHTGVKTTHLKPRWLGESDFWQQYLPPPATDETAVIVPVLRRPQAAAPFMASARASTGLATVYAVADQDDPDTAEAWAAAGAEVIVGDAVTFAKKVNLAFGKTREPWVFLSGDDVRFYPGWLDHAQDIARTYGGSVIGTNDLGNPAVIAGDHATHMLIRRSYVDEVGASWDGPGVVCHEGYRHWFVDNELVAAARQRGVWQMALGSIVEHLHPLWGKGTQDDVYGLAQDAVEADKARYIARAEANL